MNGKWSITVFCVRLAVVAGEASAQEQVAAVSSSQLIRQESVENGSVAAIGPRLITYLGLVENAGGPIDNQSMVVQFRAFPALTGGTQRGLTVTQTLQASAVRKGVFSVEMDADELALPDDADDTYLEVALCSPSHCPGGSCPSSGYCRDRCGRCN